MKRTNHQSSYRCQTVHRSYRRQTTSSRTRLEVFTPMGLLGLLVLVIAHPVAAQQQIKTPAPYQQLTLKMWDDPKLAPTEKVVKRFSPELKKIWLTALQKEQPDVRRRACFAISLASRRGITGLEATVPHLKKLVESEDEAQLIRLEAARALISLNETSAAPALLALAKRDIVEYSVTLEPALARWQFVGAKDLWLGRLSSQSSNSVGVIAAIRGLGALGGKDLATPLINIVKDERARISIRIEAAKALSQIGESTVILDLAKPKATAKSFLDRYLAAVLVANQKSPASLDLLRKLAEDVHPVVQGTAVEAVLTRDPKWANENATSMLISKEPRICICGLKALQDDGSQSAIRRIANQMNSIYPKVRLLARQILEKKAANATQRSTVLSVLDADLINRFSRRWQGLEQVALLIGSTNARSKAVLLSKELIRHERPEVAITASWAVGKLAHPDTLRDAFNHALVLSRRRKGNDLNMDDTELHFAHLMHAFGQKRYEPVVPLLNRLVPKDLMIGAKARAVAIWCLGKYYEGKENEALCVQLLERLDDIHVAALEATPVRAMCAVALGRIKTKLGKEQLELYCHDTNPSVQAACYWALNKRNGSKIPPPKILQKGYDDWFIQALADVPKKKKVGSKKPADKTAADKKATPKKSATKEK